jgi:hypothetical protein
MEVLGRAWKYLTAFELSSMTLLIYYVLFPTTSFSTIFASTVRMLSRGILLIVVGGDM